MKFKYLKMHNFMRYKGDMRIDFSMDPIKNATVITGDNTFGKTTIAQAFRWCLYGDLNSTKYSKKQDTVLLNNEVLAEMRPGMETSKVWVEVSIVDEEEKREYIFKREAVYSRKGGTYVLDAVPHGEPVFTMQISEDGKWGNVIDDSGRDHDVTSMVNSLLPEKLSNYLFFDGERWNDEKSKKADIKSSIETILGLTGLQKMLGHMKDQQYNAIGKLRGSIKNSSAEMDQLSRDMGAYNTSAEEHKKKAAEYEQLISEIEPTIEQLKEQLEQNLSNEQDQKDLKKEQQLKATNETRRDKTYEEIVKAISKDAPRFFSAQMLPQVKAVLEKLDLEGKDIPGVTEDTVDYLIEHRECICGTPLKEGSEALANLERLKNYIPPKMLGGAAGGLIDTVTDWKDQSDGFVDEIVSRANDFKDFVDAIDEGEREITRLTNKIDTRFNMADIRTKYNRLKNQLEGYERAKHDEQSKAESDIRNREEKQKRINELASESNENDDVLRAIAYAEAIVELGRSIISGKENTLINDLNELIASNFEKMFNGKEKSAKLEGDFKVHVYYRSLGGNSAHEEKVLSNGETIAINYVFIVSVLQLAGKYAEEEEKEAASGADLSFVKNEISKTANSSGVLKLPLVLDAPFSNLSSENTGLVAGHIPEFSEQAIVLMLDKDWPSSGLDKYTLPQYRYHVKKDPNKNCSEIVSEGR